MSTKSQQPTKVDQAEVNKKAKAKKKSLKGVTSGLVTILASFNNTMITISDKQGNTIVWSSPGLVGFSGSKKSTPFAAQVAASDAAKRAKEVGLLSVDVLVKGPGSGIKPSDMGLLLGLVAAQEIPADTIVPRDALGWSRG